MSLKGDKYETTEEVKFRLEQTVVLYDKEPVYITRVNMPDMEDKGEIARVYFIPLPINLGAGNAKEVRTLILLRSRWGTSTIKARLRLSLVIPFARTGKGCART